LPGATALLCFCARRDATTDEVQDLKAENEILRAKLPKRVAMTPVERHRNLLVLYPKSVCADTAADGAHRQAEPF
jgi:hypothetical protein